MSRPPARSTRWAEVNRGRSGEDYAARFAALAADGHDVHGEATLCASLLGAPARVLDAGCGTGRVAIRLRELGHDCVGVDADASMLDVAQRADAAVTWVLADLAELVVGDLGDATRFDLVVMAGNVIPLLAPGTLEVTLARMAAHLAPGGLLVSGFGLDAAHLPPGCPVTSLEEHDTAAGAAGLALVERFATWDRAPFEGPGGGYAVSVHAVRPR